MMLDVTFKDFFKDKFFKERSYLDFNDCFKSIYDEMAMPGAGMTGDIIRKPVNIDKDDIEFLRQFPPPYWAQAKKMRYDMLHDELHKVHKKRMDLGFEELKELIKKAIVSQNWDSLKGKIDDDRLSRLQAHLPASEVRGMSPKEIDDKADSDAYEEVKSKTDKIESHPDEERDFVFPHNIEVDHDSKKVLGGSKSPPITFKAKPFLNRLYHKLERTEGQPHDKDSGVEGHGEYGLDLAHPDTVGDKKITRGMSFPSDTQSDNIVSDFINLNQHQMFGDLPKGAKWLPIHGITGKILKDNWTIDQIQKKITKQMEAEASNDLKPTERKKEIERLAKEKILQLASEGKLKGPPIPGVAEEGLPVTVKNGKLEAPQLYLPHEQKDVKVKDGDNVRTTKKWVPLVNPAHYFRPLGSEESDYVTDDEGKRQFNPDGTPQFNVPEENLRGHAKDHVVLPPEQYKKGRGGHMASGAFHFNQMSRSRKFIPKGDPAYEEAKNKVFGDQEVKTDRDGNTVYSDFMKGILYCAQGDRCGEATPHEKNYVLQNTGSFHGIVVANAMKDLRNPQLYDKTGRIQYAILQVASYIQQNLGAGTRRKRVRFQNNSSPDGEMDVLGQYAKKGEIGPDGSPIGGKKSSIDTDLDQDSGGVHMPDQRGRGDKKLKTGNQEFAYSLDSLRASIKQVEEEAKIADAKSKEAAVNSDDIEKLKSSIQDRAGVLDQIKSMLVNILHKSGIEGNPEEIADSQIKSWIEDGATTSAELVSAFENSETVRKAVGTASQEPQITRGNREETPATDDVEEALKMFRTDFSHMKMSGDAEKLKSEFLAKPGQKYGSYVNKTIANKFDAVQGYSPVDYAKILDGVQKEINAIFNVKPEEMPQAAAAKEVETKPMDAAARMREIMAKRRMGQPEAAPRGQTPLIPWTQLKDEKRYVELAQHPEFHQHPELVEKLLQWFERNKATISPPDWMTAVSTMKRVLGR